MRKSFLTKNNKIIAENAKIPIETKYCSILLQSQSQFSKQDISSSLWDKIYLKWEENISFLPRLEILPFNELFIKWTQIE